MAKNLSTSITHVFLNLNMRPGRTTSDLRYPLYTRKLDMVIHIIFLQQNNLFKFTTTTYIYKRLSFSKELGLNAGSKDV